MGTIQEFVNADPNNPETWVSAADVIEAHQRRLDKVQPLDPEAHSDQSRGTVNPSLVSSELPTVEVTGTFSSSTADGSIPTEAPTMVTNPEVPAEGIALNGPGSAVDANAKIVAVAPSPPEEILGDILAVPFTQEAIGSLSDVDTAEIEQRVNVAIATDLVNRLTLSEDPNAARALQLLASEGLIEIPDQGGQYSISDATEFVDSLKGCVQNPSLTTNVTPVGVSGAIGVIGDWYIGQVMGDPNSYSADLPALPENPFRSKIWNTEFKFTPKEDPFAAIIPVELQELLGPSMEGFIWPTTGVVTSIFGWRWERKHNGVDISAPEGTSISAVADGVVDYIGWDRNGYGNFLDIRHDDGTITRYAHNALHTVTVGQQVSQGQKIAEMGSTGYSTGPHLHFEVIAPNGDRINPNYVLPHPSGFGVTIPKGPVFNGNTLAWDFSVYKQN